MKRNPTAKTKTEMFRSGLRHQPLHCRGGRVRNRSRDGRMKTSPAWFRAAPQFDCGRWKLRLELVPNGARSTTNHNGVRPVVRGTSYSPDGIADPTFQRIPTPFVLNETQATNSKLLPAALLG